MPTTWRGRPKLGVGEVGQITFSRLGERVQAEARTRDASGRLRRIRTLAASQEEAVALLKDKASTYGAVDRLSGSARLLGDLLEAWFEEIVCSRNIRDQTRTMYRTKSNKLIKLYGGIPVKDLRPARVQKIINDLAKSNSKHEYQVLKSTLEQTLRYAVLAELLPHNPASVIERPQTRTVEPPVSMTVSQVQVFRRAFAEYVREGVVRQICWQDG